MNCWRCGAAQDVAFCCSECEAVQPLGGGTDYFAVMGLGDRAPGIDEAALKQRYYALSRELHPDRFQTTRQDELTASVTATALLNAAYRTLRDVEARGKYWLERQGDGLGKDNNKVPPGLAAQVFEVQEKLFDLKNGTGEAAAEIKADLSAVAEELTGRRENLRDRLAALLEGWSEAGSTAHDELKNILSELSYLRTLDRDVRAAIEA